MKNTIFDSNTKLPLVSVGIPIRNAENRLALVIEGVLAQSYPNLEIIISDNASTDDSLAIARAFSNMDNRIKVYSSEINRGFVNFKLCLESSSGVFFVWIADDDWHSNTFVEDCVSCLLSNIDTITATSVDCFEGKEREVTSWRTTELIDESASVRKRSLYKCMFQSQGFFYGVHRTDLLRSIKFPPRFIPGWDWLIILQLASKGKIRRLKGNPQIILGSGQSQRPLYNRLIRRKILDFFLPFFNVLILGFKLKLFHGIREKLDFLFFWLKSELTLFLWDLNLVRHVIKIGLGKISRRS